MGDLSMIRALYYRFTDLQLRNEAFSCKLRGYLVQ